MSEKLDLKEPRTKKATFSLPTKILAALEQQSKQRQLNRSVIIALALEEYLQKGENNG
jgi:metal-responsive CopG/Arc/MetJ family transcriptional regulator